MPSDWLYHDGVRRGLRGLARADAMQLVDYAGPLGLPALRQLLQRRSASLGIDAPMEQILLTESGTHAVDLLCRFLLKPGDCVLVDDPSYFNYHALLKAHRCRPSACRTRTAARTWRRSRKPCRRIRRGCTSPIPDCTTRPARCFQPTSRTACWAWPNAAS